MSMTRNNFEAIAGILRGYNVPRDVREAFAEYFSTTNPAFSREWFLTAAAPEDGDCVLDYGDGEDPHRWCITHFDYQGMKRRREE